MSLLALISEELYINTYLKVTEVITHVLSFGDSVHAVDVRHASVIQLLRKY